MPMLRSPFPDIVSFSVCERGYANLDALPPDERALSETWRSAERKQLFLMGRSAAHAALEALGVDSSVPILRGVNGEPLWPEGIVGSISNIRELAGAGVTHASKLRSIGLDIERADREVRSDINSHICTESERKRLGNDSRLLLRLFSAKEALYKALFPLCRRFIRFQDMELNWEDSEGAWGVKPLIDIGLDLQWSMMRIHSGEDSGFLLSAVCID